MSVISTGIGYRGWCKVGDIMIPVTNCSLEKTPHPIKGEDLIHGSSGDNAASPIHWAQGQNAYGGDITTRLFYNFWSTLKDWLINDRITGKTVMFTPNGADAQTYTYSGVIINTATIDAAEGNNPVGLTMGCLATGRTTAGSGTAYPATTTVSGLNEAPLPYWKTKAAYSEGWGSGVEVVSWSIAVNNNAFVTYVLNNTQDPKWAQQGLLTATGNVVLYNPAGVDIPTEGGQLTVTLEFPSGNGTIVLPQIIWDSYPMPTVGPSAKVIRTMNFTAIGTDAAAAVTVT